MAIRAIARTLDIMEIPLPMNGIKVSRKAEWKHETVRNILRNETYAGCWTYGKTARGGQRNLPDNFIHVQVPAIVSRDLWLAAQEQLRQNSERAKRSMKQEYLMRGRVRCGKMACNLHGETQKRASGIYKYYVCESPPPGCDGCDSRRFNASVVDATIWEWLKQLLTDSNALQVGLEEYQAERERELRPIQERLGVVEDLLAENRRQLERLLELYLSSDFPKELLTERKTRLEMTIAAVEKERLSLGAHLAARTLTNKQIQSLQEFAAEVAQGLKVAEGDFDTRQRIVAMLDVQAILTMEDGKKVAYARCMLGERVLPVATITICGNCRHKSLRPGRPDRGGSGRGRALHPRW
jgi:site-specific DNA recombinase